MKSRDEEWKTLFGIFATESLEMLDEVEPKLVELEKETSTGNFSAETVNFIFRLFHSLKGGAAALELNILCGLTHKAENLLGLFRDGKKAISPLHIDLMCETCDLVRTLIKEIYKTFEDESLASQAGPIEQRLAAEGTEDGTTAKKAVAASGMGKSIAGALPSTAGPQVAGQEEKPSTTGSQSEQPAELSSDMAGSLDELKIDITPEMIQHFSDEAEESFEEAEQAFLAFEKDSREEKKISDAFRAIHSFKGNSGFFGYKVLEQFSHALETLMNKVRQKKIPLDKRAMSYVLKGIDTLRKTIRKMRAGGDDSIENLSEMVAELESVDELQSAGVSKTKLGEVLISHGLLTPEALEEGLHIQEKMEGKGRAAEYTAVQEASEPATAQKQGIRVDTEKLDKLVDLVGELVISLSNVTHSPEILQLKAERLSKELDRLTKTTRDLQNVAMSVRMIQIDGLFRKMIRPVRDLARSLGKKINLNFIGKDTEIDKNVIELLSDPLMHIIRNSADHGIENPDQRQAMNKPFSGTITLEARHSGSEVWIIVKDDGKGMDRQKIAQKAIEMGLLKKNPEELGDEEIFNFVFEPGFSTAAAVTEVSGRGVGMDVVKKNIEKLKGHIDVVSSPGKGTRITLRIPLTLAIIDGMVILLGKERFIVPTQSIIEFFRTTKSSISRVQGIGEAVLVRDKLLPFYRTGHLLAVKNSIEDLAQGQIMIMEIDDKRYGFLIDGILGQQQTVIKSIGSAFGEMPGIAGAAVMPDGKVGLIIDPQGLVKIAARQTVS